jgi:hypothetical protein
MKYAAPLAHSDRQRASVRVRAGRASIAIRADMSSGGLLAIGGLVSAILLSTACLVEAARSRTRD